MTNDEMRKAIALDRGFTRTSQPNGAEYFYWDGIYVGEVDSLPNYPEDLNAMHEVLSTISTHEEMWGYLHALKEIVAPQFDWVEFMCAWCVMNATARQRAEAYLRVKGLYK